ncbi:Peptidoglycan/LPS O-acetylase OafA/YrhL, contains acyltransferase and SGNH-hydrolase domains [Methylobacterium sp. 174MFSha1.1]|uniref:acyltransferase family protein n=1 Tax=Methylobacterium sp. 174MFSha1.1 TaxID=1502749 RepID=UPI0008ECFF73|nr:acyltransferase [Methylobacterium sp. 174MFSha1.1]SFU47316.1 Peptidoglycan/LPS O-acetylase OafA/YrhL, contains acyltransferase and SGNH-hydrolase domains [Methylobacterium sp. 174MFSha1.1]
MNSGERLAGIDALRGVAALAVAWLHLTNTYTGASREAGALGWLGVDGFFVLSGFVIPLALHRAGYGLARFPAFLARRLIRLEPPYLASIAPVVVLQIASSHAPGFAGRDPGYVPAQLALHLLYLIPLSGYDWINVVYWTLAYEFAFYVAAGLLFPFLWTRPLAATAAVIVGATLIVEGVAGAAEPPRFPLFLMGIAAARRHLRRDSWVSFGVGVGGAAALMAAGGGLLSALVGAQTALAATLATTSAPTRERTWSGSPLLWLGRISYSLYLTHVPVGGRVVNLGKRVVDGPLQEILLSLAALGTCLAFATLFHRAVERPFIRLSRSIVLRR